MRSLLLLRGLRGELVGEALALVARMKPELAALRKVVGRTRRKRWERGREPLGGTLLFRPMADIWDGGIHGARRWTHPRMCWGTRSAVARA